MQRLTCDYCQRATKNPCNAEFQAGCDSCMARMLASAPDWFPQDGEGVLPEYEDALRTLFEPDRQREADYEVKHWVNAIKEHKKSATI